jgi:hypothetical protein
LAAQIGSPAFPWHPPHDSIPPLVVTEIRSALVECLASTFALADDEARAVTLPRRRGRRHLPLPLSEGTHPVPFDRRLLAFPAGVVARQVQPLRQSGPGLRAALVAGGRTCNRRWSTPARARARPSASTCSINLQIHSSGSMMEGGNSVTDAHDIGIHPKLHHRALINLGQPEGCY